MTGMLSFFADTLEMQEGEKEFDALLCTRVMSRLALVDGILLLADRDIGDIGRHFWPLHSTVVKLLVVDISFLLSLTTSVIASLLPTCCFAHLITESKTTKGNTYICVDGRGAKSRGPAAFGEAWGLQVAVKILNPPIPPPRSFHLRRACLRRRRQEEGQGERATGLVGGVEGWRGGGVRSA